MLRSGIAQRHLAKMNSGNIAKLISTDSSGKVDETDTNTLAYCCFDADQVKQIFSTIELTGRVREENVAVAVNNTNLYANSGFQVSTTGENGLLTDGLTSTVQKADGSVINIPRHRVALRHGEGFAIVVPAKTKLRSGTISESNLMLRVFQSLNGAAV